MKNGFRPSSPPASPPQLLFPHWIATSKPFQVVLRNSEATTDLFLRDFSLLIPYPYPESGNLFVFQRPTGTIKYL